MANLFIGMGGSGIKTLRELQKKQNKEESKSNHYLFIDTDSKEFEGMNPDDYLDLGSANVVYYLDRAGNNPLRKKMNDWFDPACRSILTNAPLKQGASAIRPQGRASIAEMHSDYLRVVRNKVDALVGLINNQSGKEINIYIVLSVAGGTGSSIFLDLSYTLNNLIVEKNTGQSAINYTPWVILYMPDGFLKFNIDKPWVKRDYRSNVFATWKEIDAVLRDYYLNSQRDESGNISISSSGRTYFSNFAIGADQINAKNFKFQPFANAVLVDYQNEKGHQISIENNQLYKNVAQFLRFISVDEFGGQFKSDFNNTIRRHAWESIQSNQKWVKNYTTAGYTEIRGGSFLFDEYLQHQLHVNILKAIIGVEEKEISVIENLVNNLLSNHLFNRIEADGFDSRYQNKAESSIPNLYQIIKQSLNKVESNFEDLANVTKWEDVKIAAENIQTQFRSIRDALSSNFKEDLVKGNFNLRKTSEDFLQNIYTELSGVVISDGLRVVKQSLDKIDEVVDQWLAKYDNDFKLLENKKIPGNDEIKNKDLLKQIDLYYGIILNGEGAPKIMGKDDWYIKQLSDFKDLIKYYVQYKADEVLIEIKKTICIEIASGPHGDMQSRKIVRDLIAKLDIEVDVDMSKKANSLIELFKTYADDPLTRVVPDVSKFVSGFDDSDINLFKEFYETKCGLSFRKEGMVLMQNRKKKQEISADLKTLEDLISMVIEDKSLLISLLNGSTTVDSFVLSLRELLINSLETQNLRSALPKFGEISNLKLKDWVEKYPAEFENYKGDFMNRASLFCSLNTANIFDKKLWVTSLDNQHLCSEIINHNKTNNIISESKTGFTNEDVVAMIRMAENISFDDYTNYPHYKDHYAESIRTIPDVMFPHLDVRFKREMKNYPSSVDDNSIIADLMKRLSTSSEQTNTVTGNTDRVKIAFGIYGKLYFLSKFYEILKSNQIRSTLFVEPSQDDFGDPLDFPVFFKAEEILFYNVKTTSWGTISILNESPASAFSLYNNSQLLNDYRKSVFEQDHNPLWQNLIDYQAFLSDQINVIKIQKIRERTLTARVNTVIQESIKSFTTHIKEIVPEEAKDSLMQIFREIKTELDKI